MNIKDILTLSDGNKYVIASKVNHDYKIYLCLVDINNNDNVKYCYLENDEVVLVNKEDLTENLKLKLFNKILSVIKEKD